MFSMFVDNFEALEELSEVLRSQGRLLDNGTRELANIVFRIKWPKRENFDEKKAYVSIDEVIVADVSNRLRKIGVDSFVTTRLMSGLEISLRLNSKNLRIEATVVVYSVEVNEVLPFVMDRASDMMTLVADQLNCPVGECCYFVERLLKRDRK